MRALKLWKFLIFFAACWLGTGANLYAATVSTAATQGAATPQSTQVSETEAAPIMLNGIDITAVAQYFRSQIVSLKKSVFVYNWATHREKTYWDKNIPENDPGQILLFKKKSQSFWGNYGRNNITNSLYGSGLYTATDPVETHSYGGLFSEGQTPTWLLTQLELPVGFRLLDLASERTNNDVSPYIDILAKLGCIDDKESNSFKHDEFANKEILDKLFENGGEGLNPLCKEFTKLTFKNKIDGFSYHYGATDYKACKASQNLNSVAIVITESTWAKPNHVKVFNTQTSGYLEDRLRIQTLFLKTEEKISETKKMILDLITEQLKIFPDRGLSEQDLQCTQGACSMSLTFCNLKQECHTIATGTFELKSSRLITAAEAKTVPPERLLWSDLEGQAKTSLLEDWLKNSHYGCDGTLPYVEPEGAPNE